MKILLDVPIGLLLSIQQAPSKDFFITNITNQDIPVVIQGDEGRSTERVLAARELADIPCWGGALVLVNNRDHVDSWRLACGRRYALQLNADRTAFEVAEVSSR